jgi:hypothetical protein
MSAETPPTSVSSHGSSSEEWNEGVRRVVVLAYILAFAVPLAGLGLGIVLLTRPATAKSKHCVWIIAISIIASIAWVVIIGSGALKLSTNDINS